VKPYAVLRSDESQDIKSMKQCPYWEANSRLATQEIPYLLWNPEVLCMLARALHSSYTGPYEFSPLSSTIFL
jgi:hypothetical protein